LRIIIGKRKEEIWDLEIETRRVTPDPVSRKAKTKVKKKRSVEV